MAGFLETVQYILYGLFSLSILVLVHELGHFWTARWTGIRVTAFSIGFGRGIFSFERKGVKYKIGWIPFGGYCRMAGEGEDLNNEDRKGTPDEFYSRPAWARLITVSGGVAFNFIFALLIFYGLALFGYSYKTFDNRITVLDKMTAPTASPFPALSGGLKTGDRILSVNGISTPNFVKVREEIATRADQTVALRVKRGNKILKFRINTGISERAFGFIGVRYYFPAVVDSVIPNLPAAKVGLKKGDRIVAADNVAVDSFYKLRAVLQKSGGKKILLKVKRGLKILKYTLQPKKYRGAFLIGFKPMSPALHSYATQRFGVIGSAGKSFSMFGSSLGTLVSGLGNVLFHKKVKAGKALMGPVRLLPKIGETMKKASFASYLLVLATISIALGFFNLLPIPAVDGGHIVLSLVEMVRRKRLSFQVLQRIQFIGVVIVMSLAAYILIFDVMNIFGK